MAGREELIGRYGVEKLMSVIGDAPGFYTAEEVKADLEKKVASGEVDEGEMNEYMQMFDAIYEFSPDRKIVTWMKIPDDISAAELKEALDAGEITALCDGFFSLEEKEWKEQDGKFVYDTGEERELFGEAQSSFDELKFDDEGLLDFGSGMMKLKKI
ncbi:MAG: hypothetical protein IKN38_02950 [Clostridia bacterium]|nr:hypothetical protein [Clostridia bacterium]